MAKISLDSLDIKPNSHAYKNGISNNSIKKPLEPVVSSDKIVGPKKSSGNKLAKNFISNEVKNIKSYVIFDVVIPTIKNTILDIIEMAFFGKRSGPRANNNSVPFDNPTRVNYNAFYASNYYKTGRNRYNMYRNGPDSELSDVDYRNIVLLEKGDAEILVKRMWDTIDECGSVSLANLYSLLSLPSTFTDNNWGWTRKSDIGIRHVKDGYLIDVEDAVYLDD